MRYRLFLPGLLFLGLLVLPLAAAYFSGGNYIVSLVTRIVILSIAAVSLNLILGYGGMISFGHAVYLGIGAYTVGIMSYHGMNSGLIQWPVAVLVSALFALVVGALCLRARGTHFIMITLAFSQMVYFLAVGIDKYGGDDGLTIYSSSILGAGIDLANKNTLYYVCVLVMAVSLYLTHRITNSHFGMTIKASRSNDGRLQSLGVPTFAYRLTAFVISGAMCGLAGALMANHTNFVSPELMHWTRSGDLMIMVILGGLGTTLGPVIGTFVYVMFESVFSGITEYWQIALGPFLVVMAIYGRRLSFFSGAKA